MPRTKPTRTFITTTGLATLLALAPGAYSSAATQDSSPAPVRDGVSQVKITLTGDNGGTCALDHRTAKAGPITFAVTNKAATGITEIELQSNNRILGEKENLAPGLPTVSFTVTLGGGTYQIYCPGATQELQDFVVTGKTAALPTGSTAEILADVTQFFRAEDQGHDDQDDQPVPDAEATHEKYSLGGGGRAV